MKNDFAETLGTLDKVTRLRLPDEFGPTEKDEVSGRSRRFSSGLRKSVSNWVGYRLCRVTENSAQQCFSQMLGYGRCFRLARRCETL